MTDPSNWFVLKNFKCPAAGCTNKEGYSWNCPAHGSQYYINGLGKIRCGNGCYENICQVPWTCPHSFHNGGNNTGSDLESMVFSLSLNVTLMREAGAQWTSALITELGRQYAR
ncbi:hypothetical protein DPMN_161561 [Dreissena polymorpha]|uniref:Uncharacterized protein n=1 Tax=Dreissena polymorpha TaxID=45954 RepID=A0A9D4ISQ7_DREPO|nr:hypothetical protein DPMN_161561 [Dreissena polymorpha]